MPPRPDPSPDLAVSLRDRAAYLPDADALVIADLHLGRDVASAVELPLGERGDLADRLRALLAWCEPAEVVFAGDVLHSFSTLPTAVEDAYADLVGAVDDAGARLVVVRGNHDTMLDALADPVDAHPLGDGETVVLHGHEEPGDGDENEKQEADEETGEEGDDEGEGEAEAEEETTGSRAEDDERREQGEGSDGASRYLIGHDHPAVRIEGRKRPCYLLGEGVFRDADVLVLPAFNRLLAGSVVNRRTRGACAPFASDLDRFRPIVRDESADRTLVFPRLGAFRDLL